MTIEQLLPILNSMNEDDIEFGIELAKQYNINTSELIDKLEPLKVDEWENSSLKDEIKEMKWCWSCNGDNKIYRCLRWNKSAKIIYLEYET